MHAPAACHKYCFGVLPKVMGVAGSGLILKPVNRIVSSRPQLAGGEAEVLCNENWGDVGNGGRLPARCPMPV